MNKNHKAKASAKYFKSKADVTIYQSMSKTAAIGTLTKYQILHIVSNQGTWYGIKFGKGTGYIEKKSVIADQASTKRLGHESAENRYD